VAWPAGKLGDLTVFAGSPVTLNAGSTSDYGSITINAGAVLEVIPASDPTGWTYLGVAGDLTVNGTLLVHYGEHTGGTFSERGPDPSGVVGFLTGEAVSATIVQNQGGAGGLAGYTCPAYAGITLAGGAPSTGNGGGGGGSIEITYAACTICTTSCALCSAPNMNGTVGSPATATQGGNGGIGFTSPAGSGGPGATSYDGDGGDGTACSSCGPYVSGGGGGGGFRGRHGGLLYLKVRGKIGGNGSIDIAGENGGAGGMGGPYRNVLGGPCGGGYIDESGGGGGGGGAGGSGGKLVLRYNPANVMPGAIQLLQTVRKGGGQGGAGGAPGDYGAAGTNGQNGNAGDTSDMQSF
jgi:hypothetical protein